MFAKVYNIASTISRIIILSKIVIKRLNSKFKIKIKKQTKILCLYEISTKSYIFGKKTCIFICKRKKNFAFHKLYNNKK